MIPLAGPGQMTAWTPRRANPLALRGFRRLAPVLPGYRSGTAPGLPDGSFMASPRRGGPALPDHSDDGRDHAILGKRRRGALPSRQGSPGRDARACSEQRPLAGSGPVLDVVPRVGRTRGAEHRQVKLVLGPQWRYLSLGLAGVDGIRGGRHHRWLDKSLVVTELDDLAE